MRLFDNSNKIRHSAIFRSSAVPLAKSLRLSDHLEKDPVEAAPLATLFHHLRFTTNHLRFRPVKLYVGITD